MKRNPIRRPGKFSLFIDRYAYEYPDDEIGRVDELGWYGYFSGKIKGRGPFHLIVSEDNYGFVTSEIFDSKKSLDKSWARIVKAYDRFYDEQGE
jgi:hypothetical protein